MNVGGVDYRTSDMLKFDKFWNQTTIVSIIWVQLVSVLWHWIGKCSRYQTTVSQRERTPLTGHILLPSNRNKKPTNRNKLGDQIDYI